MRKLMSRHNLLQKIILGLVILAGSLPVLLFVSIEAGLAESISDTTADTTVVSSVDRFVENVAFGIGEKLEFDINYGFINAGTASLEVARLIEYNSRPAYQIVSLAESNSFFSSFYRVEDRAESIMDALGIFSWKFEKNIREGGYSSDRLYAFDQKNHFTVYKGDTIAVEPFVQDALSVMYYTRTQNLEVGKSIFVPNFIDGRKMMLEVQVQKREKITVPAGTFDCIVVEPISTSVGLFKHEGTLKVWLTDDRLKMPVLMKSKVVVGSISAELTDYKLGEIGDF